MHRRPPIEQSRRFNGTTRHYHRSHRGDYRGWGWNEWVEGSGSNKCIRKWLHFAFGLIAVLGLGVIIIGLIDVLRIQPVPGARLNTKTPADGVEGAKQAAPTHKADSRL